MSQYILSILIPTLVKRGGFLASLLKNLHDQKNNLPDPTVVEILTESDSGEQPTGTKRNTLLQKSSGKYIVFVDDDDEVPDYYISEILKAAETDCDAMGINGIITFDGRNPTKWFISKDLPYDEIIDENGEKIYRRYNNHISPMKRSIAIRVRFKDWVHREDYEWCTEIHNKKLIKTETTIERPMYFYKYVEKGV